MFSLFNDELGYAAKEIKGKSGAILLNRPAVVLAAGERFAAVKKLRPVHDANNALILPAISIRRTGIAQTDQDITSRGINQMTGELVIKRRLDPSDRDYQGLLNKLLLRNTQELTNNRRDQGEDLTNDVGVQQGVLFDPDLGNNIFEIITIPSPQFYTANYEVVFWTTHEQHMNYLLETMFANFLPQRRGFKITSPKGYWFLADVGESFTDEGNAKDYTEEKRLLRYSFTVKVQGFIFAPDAPGLAVPIRRYISAPQISFDLREGSEIHKCTDFTRWERNPELPNTPGQQPPTTLERFVSGKEVVNRVTGATTKRYVQVSDQNKRSGETIYTASSPAVLAEFLFQGNPKKTR